MLNIYAVLLHYLLKFPIFYGALAQQDLLEPGNDESSQGYLLPRNSKQFTFDITTSSLIHFAVFSNSYRSKMGTVVHLCNLSPLEAEVGRLS